MQPGNSGFGTTATAYGSNPADAFYSLSTGGTINGSLEIKGNLTVDQSTILRDVECISLNAETTITANGSIISQGLLAGASAIINGPLTAATATVSGALSAGAATVNGALSAGAATVSGSLTVGGPSNLQDISAHIITATNSITASDLISENTLTVGPVETPVFQVINNASSAIVTVNGTVGISGGITTYPFSTQGGSNSDGALQFGNVTIFLGTGFTAANGGISFAPPDNISWNAILSVSAITAVGPVYFVQNASSVDFGLRLFVFNSVGAPAPGVLVYATFYLINV